MEPSREAYERPGRGLLVASALLTALCIVVILLVVGPWPSTVDHSGSRHAAGTDEIFYIQGPQIRKVSSDGTGDALLTAVDPERSVLDLALDDTGTRLAFVNGSIMQGGDPSQIEIINTDGSDRHVAVASPDLPAGIFEVDKITWSPDGQQLAICTRPRQRSFVIALDGSKPRQVGPTPFCVTDWSPDGRRLLGIADGIVAINRNGTHQRVLAPGVTYADPSWSPDGTHIVYWDELRDGRGIIYSMRSDGTDHVRLTGIPGEADAAWSSEGTRIVYVSRDLSLWTMNSAGEDRRQVLGMPAPDTYWPATPAWLRSS